jgi:hypothetical protein
VTELAFPFAQDRRWWKVNRDHQAGRELADRHYSRRTVGGHDFMSCGRTFVLLTECHRAVWGVIENDDPTGGRHWRCSIFRNEGAGLSSDLIREATGLTFDYWDLTFGRPAVPLRTEVDPRKTKHKRDPGRCFIKAGWKRIGITNGLVILEAPGQ